MSSNAKFKVTEIGKIPFEWDVKTIREVSTNFDSKRVPLSNLQRAIMRGEVPYYGASGIIDYVNKHLFEGEFLLISEDGENLKSRKTPIAFIANGKFWVNNHAHIIQSNQNSNLKYLLYWFQVGDISSYLTGSVQPKLSQENLNKIKIPIPSLEEQKAIGAVLSSLDDKISLNRSMNSTLEAIGQALFKHWFVDFEFPNEEGKPYRSSGGEMVGTELGEVPKGWRVDLITEVADVVDCLHIKKPTQTEKGQILLQLYNIGEYGLLDFKELYHVSPEDYKVWTKNIQIKQGDCILTNAGLAGAIAQIPYGYEVGLGRNITAVRPVKITPAYLIRYLFSEYGTKEIQKNLDVGTIFNSLNVKGIRKVRMLIPDQKIMYKFETLARPLRKTMEKNVYENLCLSEIRDALLPKLMSGEIRVNTIKHISMSNVV